MTSTKLFLSILSLLQWWLRDLVIKIFTKQTCSCTGKSSQKREITRMCASLWLIAFAAPSQPNVTTAFTWRGSPGLLQHCVYVQLYSTKYLLSSIQSFIHLSVYVAVVWLFSLLFSVLYTSVLYTGNTFCLLIVIWWRFWLFSILLSQLSLL
jgi:hypothetical protein